MQVLPVCLLLAPLVAAPDRSAKLAETYVDAVAKLNDGQRSKPKAKSEAELAAQLPKKAERALGSLLKLEKGDDLAASLEGCARAALDLDRLEDFMSCKSALAAIDPEAAEVLGCATSRERFLVIGEGGLDQDYVEHFAEVVGDVLEAYDAVFGFEEFSKIPGKKLRVRVPLVDKITRPPHFAPQYRWHSEVNFPVIDAEAFRSPTADGKFLFYGLCHELGHVIAMWGSPSNEEDHHAWAHYTGLAIVEHFAALDTPPDWLAACRDVRWRSFAKERERLGDAAPGVDDRDSTLALLLAVHESVGPQAIGEAINVLDRKDKRRRVNAVRYYTFEEFSEALLASAKKDKELSRTLKKLFDG